MKGDAGRLFCNFMGSRIVKPYFRSLLHLIDWRISLMFYSRDCTTESDSHRHNE